MALCLAENVVRIQVGEEDVDADVETTLFICFPFTDFAFFFSARKHFQWL
jgi:hypothetical protein